MCDQLRLILNLIVRWIVISATEPNNNCFSSYRIVCLERKSGRIRNILTKTPPLKWFKKTQLLHSIKKLDENSIQFRSNHPRWRLRELYRVCVMHEREPTQIGFTQMPNNESCGWFPPASLEKSAFFPFTIHVLHNSVAQRKARNYNCEQQAPASFKSMQHASCRRCVNERASVLMITLKYPGEQILFSRERVPFFAVGVEILNGTKRLQYNKRATHLRPPSTCFNGWF